MKRLVWILLAIVSTALAQVQPVTFPTPLDHKCSCCDGDGSCGMPDCVPPAPARTLPTADQATRVTVMQARAVAAPAATTEKFFAAFVRPAAVAAAPRASQRMAPSASVPLFAAHCSYLI